VQQTEAPVIKDLVLAGGGHSHVAVLKSFGMQRMPGVRLTLISQDVSTPYSGMIPGLIAGHYQFDQTHIDLRPLCRFAGAQFCHDAVIGLDLVNKRLLCGNRPPLSFDVLSINIGATPRAHDTPGALQHAWPVKPIDRFLQTWEEISRRALEPNRPRLRIAVVGGGAGGVELTLAARHRLLTLLQERGAAEALPEFHLLTNTRTVLPTHNRRVQSKFARLLGERGVQVHLEHRVVQVQPGLVKCDPGQAVPCDVVLWVTDAAAPRWLAECGLKTDAAGFLAVNDCLQSVSHPFVFAAGDIANVLAHPRPKSGVFAVRQGPHLAANLRLALANKPLVPFRPQKNFLSLISTGNKYAVASRGPWAWEGEWVWRWKDWIDRRWMKKYQVLPTMPTPPGIEIEPGLAGAEALQEISTLAMRCGGCGAKVGSTILTRVLQRLKPIQRDDILVGLQTPDDASVVRVPPGQVSVQTVDFFRSFINDPYLFGRITALHCLGDIFAMGATPQSALALATVPFGLEAKVEEQLYQVMAGAVEVLNQHDTALAGGHTAEGAELVFGLVVNGLADPNRLLRKGGIRPGDRLVLTKPLGTGTLLAAEMRGQAKAAWVESALASMLRSNREGGQCFLRHHARACTDVTGFGLLGHLVEMIQPSPDVAVELTLEAVPILEGVLATIRAGILSSLQPQNLRLRHAIRNTEEAVAHERYPVLFDPQTAGGLLASVPAADAAACLAELKQLGYTDAAIIGIVTSKAGEEPPITISSRF
jgi:selenide,water dikinase